MRGSWPEGELAFLQHVRDVANWFDLMQHVSNL
jgi:hypothetical protein